MDEHRHHEHPAHEAPQHQQHGEKAEQIEEAAHAEHASPGNHHAMMVADFRRRFWVSLALTMPILALSPDAAYVKIVMEPLGIGL